MKFKSKTIVVNMPTSVEIPCAMLKDTCELSIGYYDFRGEYYVVGVDVNGLYDEFCIYPSDVFAFGTVEQAIDVKLRKRGIKLEE